MKENEKPYYSSLASLFTKSMDEVLNPIPAATFTERFSLFNKITAGLRPNEFTVFCGSTGKGKTTLIANLSADLLIKKTPHFVASIEAGHTDFVRRVFSCLSGIDINDGEKQRPEVIERIYREHKEIVIDNNLFLSLYENRLTVETLMKDIEYMRKNHNCKVAFIDNLNFFLEPTSAANQLIELDRVIHELIIFCKNCDVHVWMVMHPRKTLDGRVVSVYDVKGSSTSVQEAQNVFFFNPVSQSLIDSGEAQENDREILIAKMRRRGQYTGKSLILGGSSVRYVERKIVHEKIGSGNKTRNS